MFHHAPQFVGSDFPETVIVAVLSRMRRVRVMRLMGPYWHGANSGDGLLATGGRGRARERGFQFSVPSSQSRRGKSENGNRKVGNDQSMADRGGGRPPGVSASVCMTV